MSEKKVTPKIEEIAENLFDGDKLKNFLDFNEFLKNNKLTKGSTAKTACRWMIKYKNKRLCHLMASKDFWAISYYKDKEIFEKCENYITDELKEFILENINTKPGCKNSKGGKCKGIENINILGKMFDRVCGCHMLMVTNPDGKTLEYAKEIVLINKSIVDDIVASRA